MYRERPNLMIGFHGCDESVRDSLVREPGKIKMSQESYDWLGHGFYVWENNSKRARQWAEDKKLKRSNITTPSVVGVVYQLRHCLDLTDSEFIELLPTYHKLLKQYLAQLGMDLPRNKDIARSTVQDLLIRELDCAVIEYLHQSIENEIASDKEKKGCSELAHFDTVRGLFTEGGPAFDGAGIQKKNHIQVCIRNPNCIKAFFIPRSSVVFP